MASGERVKVWFKEIENNLASRWHGAITCEELRALALDLTVKMRRFRDQSGIESPIYYCPSCKKYERAGPQGSRLLRDLSDGIRCRHAVAPPVRQIHAFI